jgi:predicted methyltransferase
MTYLQNDIYIGRSLDLYGEYSEGEVALFREFLRPGDTALDIGANVGALTLAMAGLVGPQGTVHAFEPQGAIFDLLQANVAANDLTQVAMHRKAVGEAFGTLSMPSPDYAQPNNFGAIALNETAGETLVDGRVE